MNSNAVSVTNATSVSSPLTALPTAKIVRHPKAKQLKEEHAFAEQPDEETLLRLNAMAKKYPFCILQRGNNHSWLL
jgi:hypothetical protein